MLNWNKMETQFLHKLQDVKTLVLFEVDIRAILHKLQDYQVQYAHTFRTWYLSTSPLSPALRPDLLEKELLKPKSCTVSSIGL